MMIFGCGRDQDLGGPDPITHRQLQSVQDPDPVPWQILDQYYRQLWESLFSTPYDAQTSGTFLDRDIDQPGSYAGWTDTGEGFTLEVTGVLYYTQSELVALNPQWQDMVDLLDLRLSFYVGVLASGQGSAPIFGYATAGTYEGAGFSIPRPVTDALPPGFPAAAPAAGKSAAAPAGEDPVCLPDDEMSDCLDHCLENSDHPDPPELECAPGWYLDQACLAQCKQAYHAAVDAAVQAFCDTACVANEEFNEAWNDCFEEAGVEWAGGTLLLLIPGGWGAAIGVISDAVMVGGLVSCLNAAGEAFDAELTAAQAKFNESYQAAYDAYIDCAWGCCREVPRPIRERIR